MGLIGAAARLVAREIATSMSSATGQGVGEALGRRLGNLVYDDPVRKLEERVAELEALLAKAGGT